MIEMMDAGIGQLLAAIDRLDLREQTVIIFASDNGPDPLVETRFNLGLRGTKYTIYEGGIRVPLMIRWPGHLKPSQQNALVHFTDLLPTLIDLCQLAPASDLPFDGASFAPAMSGESSDLPTHRFWQWNRGTPRYTHNAAIREGTWKLVRPFVTRNLPKEESTRAVALYDLTEDPTESRDVSREHPDRARRMSDALKDWCRDVERDRTRQE
jgi:arylsulfatase A